MSYLPIARKRYGAYLGGQEEVMNKYVIERDVPGIGKTTPEGFKHATESSNKALESVGDGIQWQESYITGDKIFCVYLADNEEKIREHAKKAGLPANRIHKVKTVLDPTSAND
jgi:hypothetical protein